MVKTTGEESAAELLLKCIDEGRVDVLCSILAQLSKFPRLFFR